MVMFALNPSEVQNGYDNASRTPYDPLRDSAPGFFDNSLGVIPGALENSAAGLLLAATHAPGSKPLEKETEQDVADILKRNRPDPQVTGWLGNVMYGVTNVVPQAVLGSLMGGPVGAAVVVYNAQAEQERSLLQSDGVDPQTALKAARVAGGMQALGVVAPASVAGGLLTRTVSGATINTVIGATQRGVTGKILADAGYTDMADQYKVLDSAAIFTDAILGGVFGTLHGDGTRPTKKAEADPLPSEIDAALAANNLRHLEIDSAPGIPADLATRNAHAAAMDRAMDQLIRGEPVDVSEPLQAANFLRKPEPVGRQEITDHLSAELGDLHTTTAINTVVRSEEKTGVRTEESLTTREQAEVIARAESPALFQELARVQDLYANLSDRAKALTERVGSLTPEETAAAEKINEIEAELKVADDSRRIKRLERKREELLGQHTPGKREQIQMYNELQFLSQRAEEIKPETRRLAQQAWEKQRRTEQAIALNAQAVSVDDALPGRSVAGEPIGTLRDAIGIESPRPIAGDSPSRNAPVAASPEQQIAAEKPGLQIVDEDGNAVTAGEALAKADQDVARAEKDAGLFETAINCFLRFGDEG